MSDPTPFDPATEPASAHPAHPEPAANATPPNPATADIPTDPLAGRIAPRPAPAPASDPIADPATAAEVHLFPIDLIDTGALSRDRTGLDEEPQTELERSIRTSGLRQPIEIFERATPFQGKTHGLLSGYRRLLAYRALHERTGKELYAKIPAFIRERQELPQALAAMVEENEIRADIAPYERGLIAVTARDMGAFASIEEAIEGLYPAARRQKRLRLRAVAHFAEEVGGFFATPEKLTERQIERLMRAVSGGFGNLIRTALEESSITDLAHQWKLVQPIIDEAEADARDPGPPSPPGRPRRILRPRNGVTIRRERTQDGWCLHITGREASGPMIDTVMDNIEIMYARS